MRDRQTEKAREKRKSLYEIYIVKISTQTIKWLKNGSYINYNWRGNLEAVLQNINK